MVGASPYNYVHSEICSAFSCKMRITTWGHLIWMATLCSHTCSINLQFLLHREQNVSLL